MDTADVAVSKMLASITSLPGQAQERMVGKLMDLVGANRRRMEFQYFNIDFNHVIRLLSILTMPKVTAT